MKYQVKVKEWIIFLGLSQKGWGVGGGGDTQGKFGYRCADQALKT